MQPTAKYQPYHGYGSAHPCLWYGGCVPKRVRTHNGWRYPSKAEHHPEHAYRGGLIEYCRACGRVHCRWCSHYAPWQNLAKRSGASGYEKRLAHRTFRRRTRDAIRREMFGEEVSHNFRYYGDWLD